MSPFEGRQAPRCFPHSEAPAYGRGRSPFRL
jgi:hypothetical protein